MKVFSLLAFLFFVLISLSLVGSVHAGRFNESLSKTKDFHSRYFGISLQYPGEGTFIHEEDLVKNREFGEYKKFRVMYIDNTTGLYFRIIGVRFDIDPELLPEKFNGSEGCGGFGTDDRDNLTILEFYSPDSIGGVKASRSMVILHELGNDTIETTYEICKIYKSGISVEYYIFWSAPSDEFFTVRPVVKDIVNSIEFFEPLGLYHLGVTPDQFSLDFPYNQDIFDRFNNSEWGISFRHPKDWNIYKSFSDAENFPQVKTGRFTFANRSDDITMEIEVWKYDVRPHTPINNSLAGEGLLCIYECPECDLRLNENFTISGQYTTKTTTFLMKNNTEYIRETWMVCPGLSGYKIVYSVPSEKWETVEPFFQGLDFINKNIRTPGAMEH